VIACTAETRRETEPRDHTYSALARILEFTERKPWNTAPSVYTIRFVCGDNTDEWLARLYGLLLLPVVYRTRVAYTLNTAIRRTNYCGFVQ
jgi:hypothetical protein